MDINLENFPFSLDDKYVVSRCPDRDLQSSFFEPAVLLLPRELFLIFGFFVALENLAFILVTGLEDEELIYDAKEEGDTEKSIGSIPLRMKRVAMKPESL